MKNNNTKLMYKGSNMELVSISWLVLTIVSAHYVLLLLSLNELKESVILIFILPRSDCIS